MLSARLSTRIPEQASAWEGAPTKDAKHEQLGARVLGLQDGQAAAHGVGPRALRAILCQGVPAWFWPPLLRFSWAHLHTNASVLQVWGVTT